MTDTLVDLYFSYRSPYSYLAVRQVRAIEAAWQVAFAVRVVRPLAVRVPDFFQRVNPLWPPYLMRDTQRIAERLGLPYRWPTPDPIVQNFATREVAAEQPYIGRLSRLGVLAAERGAGLAFAEAVTALIWGSGERWDEGDRLAGAAASAGFDLAELDAAQVAEQDRLDGVIAANEAAQAAAGHWGVPLFVYDGEPFFGQDRLEDLVWRLEQRGVVRR